MQLSAANARGKHSDVNEPLEIPLVNVIKFWRKSPYAETTKIGNF